MPFRSKDMRPSRREMLIGAAAGGMIAAAARAPAALAAEDAVYAAFEASAEINPWTLGWRSARADRFETPQMELVSGRAPEGLRGVFYRNGPAKHDRAGWRYRHWFDGDGMVHAYRFGEAGVSHLGRFVETDKWRAEQEAGRFLTPAFGSVPGSDTGVSGPDDINVANTSVLPIGDAVWALWEGGSATALDGASLDTVGPVALREDLAGLPFSAHPKVDPSGRIWNFGHDAFGGRLVVYELSAAGDLARAKILGDMPRGMIHDFVITDSHLVFGFPPLEAVRPRWPYFESFAWLGEKPLTFVVVAKDTLEVVRRVEAPAGMHFHFGNAWESADGEIHLDVCMAPDARWVLEGARALMRGEVLTDITPTSHCRVRLPADGGAVVEAFDTAPAEFPRVDPRRVGRPTRHSYVTLEGGYGLVHGIGKRDIETGALDRFTFGDAYIAEEHVFVPDPDGEAEDQGWLVGTALNLVEARTELNVFDAQAVSAGPIARWALSHPTPLGFHGAWRGA